VTLLEERPAESIAEERICVLATERLILRAPRMQDAEAVTALLSDRRVSENTTRIQHPYTRADAESFIARVNQTAGEPTFVVTAGEDVIGCCGLARLDGEKPELGYWFGVPFWGQGYATEAVRAVIDHAFTDLGCDQLLSGARINNPASRRVLEKCGFQWTGVGLYRIRAISSSAPVDRFRLERGIWAALKTWGKAKRVV
jgi:RimJ/RimL family protein N-acetyltransferase